jgi:hypothetical protein
MELTRPSPIFPPVPPLVAQPTGIAAPPLFLNECRA